MRPDPRPAADPQPPHAWRRIKRVLTFPLVLVAVAVVLFDDLFRPWVKAAVVRLARLRLWRRTEAFVATLSPYATMALFVVPMAVIWPFKLYALYLIGSGHVVSGVLTLVAAKIVGVGLAERLFAISRNKLLSIRWFAWCFARAVALKDTVNGWMMRTRFWAAAKRLAARTRETLRRVRAWAGRRFGGDRGALARRAAALRLRLVERWRARAGAPGPS